MSIRTLFDKRVDSSGPHRRQIGVRLSKVAYLSGMDESNSHVVADKLKRMTYNALGWFGEIEEGKRKRQWHKQR